MIERLKRKASSSVCRHMVGAISYDKRGNILCVTNNSPRHDLPSRRGSGRHAEAAAMLKFGKRIETIIILRINKRGDLLKISPCKNCSKLARKLNIQIKTL